MKELFSRLGQRLFTLPVFSDPEKTQAASQLFSIVRAFVLAATFLQALQGIIAPWLDWHWLVLLLTPIAVSLALLELARRGRVRPAAFLLVVSLWLLITVFSWTASGLGARAAWGYFIVVFIAGMLLGKWAGIVAAGFCSASTLFIALHSPGPSSDPVRFWLINTLFLVIVILLQNLASRSIRESLAEAKRQLQERHQAETALVQSEKKHREMVNSLPFCVFESDLRGRLTFANQTALRSFGYSETDLADGLNILQLVVPEEQPRAKEDLHRVVSGEEISFHEFLVRRKDGSHFAALIRTRRIMGNGTPLGLQGSLIDISERKQADEAIQIRDRAFESSFSAIVIADLDGKITYVNKAFSRMWGYSVDEALALNVMALDSNQQEVVQVVQDIKTKGFCIGESVAVRKDLSLFHIEFSASLVRNAAGDAIAMLSTFIDISERKRAEQEKEQVISLQRATIESTADGILVIDHEGRITDFNQRFSQMWGIPESVLAARDDARAIQFVLDQLQDPEGFTAKVRELYAHPDQESFDLIRFKDGRCFERYSRPQLISGQPVGRVWSFRDISERQQGEDKLIESERRYRALFEAANDGILLLQETCFVDCNRKILELFGYTREQFPTIPQSMLSPEKQPDGSNSREKAMERYRAAMAGYPQRFEWIYLRSDGTSFPAEVSLNNVELSSGIHLLIFIHDITERKRAEEALRESEEKYRQTMNVAPIGIYVVQDMRFKFVNPEMARLHGYQPEEMIDSISPPDALVAPEDRETVRQILLNRQEGVRGLPYEIKARRKDGSTFDAMVQGQGISYKGSVASVGSLVDITGLKQAEASLKESEHRYRTLFESAGDSIFVMKDNLFFDCNSKTLEMFGCRREQIIGVSPDKFSPPLQPDGRSSRDKATEKIAAAYSGTPQTFEWQHCKADGTPFMAEVSLNRFKLGSGFCLLAIVRDITEHNLLEEQLRQAQKMEAVGILAGGVAHDFNNILSSIVGYASLLQMLPGLDKKVKEYLERILASTERAASLTHSLLAFSRKQAIELQPVDLNEAISGFHKVLTRLIGEDIDFRLELAGNTLVVDADIRQIEQVLMNLATNSRDAMPNGGRLTIATRSEIISEERGGVPAGAYALISVSDTGSGMNSEVRSHLFEPFFTTKEVGKGTGLGLAIVYGIIKNHHGFIRIESEAEHSTAFHIYLPLNPLAVRQSRRKRKQKIPRGDETILLVEDDAAVRHATRSVLEEFGYTVLEAADGIEALAVFEAQRERIDLLVCDLIMPKINGQETRAGILKIKPGVKTLFISGYTNDIIARKGIEDPGVHLLLKPLHPARLLIKVREVLDA